MRTYSTSLVIKKMQIKIITEISFFPAKKEKKAKTGENRRALHCQMLAQTCLGDADQQLSK
jgi:hypothetical protein